MKKILAMMLTAAMMLSMGTAAMAADVDDTTTQIKKTYQVNSGKAPAEDFTYTFTAVKYQDGDSNVYEADAAGVCVIGEESYTIPTIGNVTISFDAMTETTTKTSPLDIDADDYRLGVYTYKVEEVIPSPEVAGITYSEQDMYLVLTILRDEESQKYYVAHMHYYVGETDNKNDDFVNEYDSGSLSVTKEIEGNMADMNKKFAFTITFTAPVSSTADDGTVTYEPVESEITVTKPDQTTETITFEANASTRVYTIMLGDGETVSFANLPEGTTYTISEVTAGYTQTTEDSKVEGTEKADNKIEANDNDAIVYVNTLENPVDTGISVDSIPYIAMLGVVAVGGAGFMVSKKRRSED